MEFLPIILLAFGFKACIHFTGKIVKEIKNSLSSRKPYFPVQNYVKTDPNYLQPLPPVPTTTNLHMPYELNSSLLTNREIDFFHMLRYILKDTYYFIAIKPRMADFINVTSHQKYNPSVFWHYFNQISAKHVDFLICDEFMRPTLAIELDDSTHEMEERVKRDEFVNNVYSLVGLNIIHVNDYSLESVKNLLSEFLLFNTAVSV